MGFFKLLFYISHVSFRQIRSVCTVLLVNTSGGLKEGREETRENTHSLKLYLHISSHYSMGSGCYWPILKMRKQEARYVTCPTSSNRHYGFVKFQGPPLTHKPLDIASLAKIYIFISWIDDGSFSFSVCNSAN